MWQQDRLQFMSQIVLKTIWSFFWIDAENVNAVREKSSVGCFASSPCFGPPGGTWIEIIQEVAFGNRNVAIATQPSPIFMITGSQGAFFLVQWTETFATPFACLEFLLQVFNFGFRFSDLLLLRTKVVSALVLLSSYGQGGGTCFPPSFASPPIFLRLWHSIS